MPRQSETGTPPDAEHVVAGYRVERVLRRHSPTDAVFDAFEVERDQRVELRVLLPGADEELRDRFIRGAALLSALDHRSLPRVLDAGSTEDAVYMATAPLEGVPLATLTQGGGLPPMRALRLLGEVGDALDAAHAEGLVHGDVCLDSVMVVQSHVEEPYLVDFLLGSPRAADGPAATTPAGDVRALACTLFECLTGRRPRQGGHGEPQRMRDLVSDVPLALDEVVAAAIAASAGQPTRSAGELMRAASQTLLDVSGPASSPGSRHPLDPTVIEVEDARRVPTAALKHAEEPPRPGRLRRGLSAGLSPAIALLLIAVAAATGYLLGRPGDGEADTRAASVEGLSATLPAGWENADTAPSLPGLELEGVLAAGPGGSPTLVAGRLPGLQGSVYPAAVAERVDRQPPPANAVGLATYDALRWDGIDAGDAGRLTLYVAPTSAGTLVAACLPGGGRACAMAASSLELEGGRPSSLSATRRFAARLNAILDSLQRRREAGTAALRSAEVSGAQARAARELADADAAALAALRRASPPPAAAAAARRLGSILRASERAYERLAAAAAARNGDAFERALRAARRSEARLQALLRGL